MQLLDPAAIASRIGSIQGSTLQQSAFGLNVGGPPLPGVQTTANTGNAVNTLANGTSGVANTGNAVTTTGSGTSNQQVTGGTSPGTTTGQTSSSQLVVTGPSTVTTTAGNNQTVTTGPSTTTVTTLAAPTAPTVPAPVANAFTPPSAYAPAASNILNQQVELTYQITGLALLLEGALNDRYMRVGGTQLLRRRATIGVPVTITPPDDATDMVAEVILEVTTSHDAILKEPPALMAILPRDKTYNVASITNKSVSLGGGVVTQVISAGVSGLWGHQTYFLVEDQDTVAIQLAADPDRSTTTRFGWQIRPVLGQKTVQAGMRMLFAQLAFPLLNNATTFGTVHVITQWRKLNRKKNTLEAPIHSAPVPGEFAIPRFDQTPQFGSPGLEDNGDGTLTVQVESDGFAPGTFVRIGSGAIQPGAANALFDSTGIRFTASAALLATHGAFIVDRSGAASEIIDPMVRKSTGKCLTIKSAEAKAVNASTALVTVDVAIDSQAAGCDVGVSQDQLVALVGNRVFGYRDAPMQSVTPNLTFLAPLDLVRGSPKVEVKRVFFGDPFRNDATITFPAPAAIDKALVVSQSDDEVKLALTGSGLAGLKSVVPPSDQVKFDTATDIGAVVSIQRGGLKNVKQIVFESPAGELLMVAAPDLSGGGPQLQPHTAIKAGAAASITVTGSGLADFDHVECQGKKLSAVLANDRKSVTIDVPSALMKAGTLDLVFFFKKAEKITYTVTLFDTKVDLPQQPAPAK